MMTTKLNRMTSTNIASAWKLTATAAGSSGCLLLNYMDQVMTYFVSDGSRLSTEMLDR